jgi:hypothetical protein
MAGVQRLFHGLRDLFRGEAVHEETAVAAAEAQDGVDSDVVVDDDDDSAEEAPATPPRERTRKRTRSGNPVYTATKANLLRLATVLMVVQAGMTSKNACEATGMACAVFSRQHWVQRFTDAEAAGEDGFAAVLDERRRGTKKRKISPRTEAKIHERLRAGAGAGEVRADLMDMYTERGELEREPPTVRRLQQFAVETDYRFLRGGRPAMITTPWCARWRVTFAEKWEQLLEEDPTLAQRLIFADEKKFCLHANKLGRWIHADTKTGIRGYNVAKEEDMGDGEYKEWRKDNKRAILPHDKQRGLYPLFAFGVVGFNVKSELYILAKDETLTKSLFLDILRDEHTGLADMLKRNGLGKYGRRGRPVLALDNDVKHYNVDSRALFEELGVDLMGAPRLNEAGTGPDVQSGPGGHPRTFDEEYFPPYSPDINSPIEKCWGEVQRRVHDRADEIKSERDMERVVREEWDNLEFEPSERWCGINYLVTRTQKVLQAVIAEHGFDTRYMK